MSKHDKPAQRQNTPQPRRRIGGYQPTKSKLSPEKPPPKPPKMTSSRKK